MLREGGELQGASITSECGSSCDASGDIIALSLLVNSLLFSTGVHCGKRTKTAKAKTRCQTSQMVRLKQMGSNHSDDPTKHRKSKCDARNLRCKLQRCGALSPDLFAELLLL